MLGKLKVLGLAFVVILALTAVASAAAQADTAHWTVGGTTLGSAEQAAIAETVKVTPESEPMLTLKVSSGLEITCTGLGAVGGVIKETNKDSVEKLTFTGCTVKNAPAACQVKSFGETGWGMISTVPLKSQAIVPATPGGVYDKFEPASGTTFTTIVIEKTTGHTCAFSTGASGNPVTGSAAGLGVISNSPAEETVYQKLTFNAASATAAGAALLYGGTAATFEGEVDLKLASEKVWGIEVTNP